MRKEEPPASVHTTGALVKGCHIHDVGASGVCFVVDPARGDFSVKDGSPAFRIGFKNFAMDQFGVKKPALRPLAGTPVIPRLRQEGDSDD